MLIMKLKKEIEEYKEKIEKFHKMEIEFLKTKKQLKMCMIKILMIHKLKKGWGMCKKDLFMSQ
jgi:cellobiose-specific phosphotransferase system component IIA